MDSKRQRADKVSLANVVHMRGVCGNALHRIVNTLIDTDLIRHEVEVASYARFHQVSHTLRFPSVHGGDVSYEMCELKALLALLLNENRVTRQWFEEAWHASPSTPSTPWLVTLDWDEVTLGEGHP